MMKSYRQRWIRILVTGFLGGCGAAPELTSLGQALDGETLLDMPVYSQGTYHNLSWAAATAMFISYCNRDTIDRTLDLARDYAANEERFDVTPPGSSVPELIRYLGKHSRCRAGEQPGLLMWEELKVEIQRGHPIYARVDYWDLDMQLTGEGYVAVIRGYDERHFASILVYYPGLGEERWELWNYFATNRLQVWTATGLLLDEEPPATSAEASNPL